MATWPSTLPRPSGSYEVAPVDQTIRTDMETGAARVRRRTAARNDRVTLQWTFTDAQMGVYRAWFESGAGAAGGAAWFDIPLAVGGNGVSVATARFVNGPGKFSQVGGKLLWTVAAELEIRNA